MTRINWLSFTLAIALGAAAGCTSQSVASDGVPGGPGGPGGDPTNPPPGSNVPKGLRVDDWHIGNGGDMLRKHIIDSKKKTRKILDKIRPKALVPKNDKLSAVKPFVVKYRKRLAYDINVSQFRYYDKKKDKHKQNTCAYTWPKEGQPVVLQYDLCKATLRSAHTTSWLILHELAHHFQNLPDVAPIVASMPGETDNAKQEEFADAVAELVLDAWRSGRLEWETIPTEGAPQARSQHSAVWTDESLVDAKAGSEYSNAMIVWGGVAAIQSGTSGRDRLADGAAYSVDREKWLPISSDGAPSARSKHDAIWTGSKMIVWGGRGGSTSSYIHDGGIWDAATDSWELISYPWQVTSPMPKGDGDARIQTLTLISEKEAMIYGAIAEDDEGRKVVGAIYNFAEKDPAKRWRPIYEDNALVKVGGHTATFVGKNKVFLFGGYGADREKTNAAALYDFRKNTWEDVPVDPQMTPRTRHTAVYSSHGVIVFGRRKKASGVFHLHGTGAFYDVHAKKDDKWTRIMSQSAPERYGHSAVWTGNEMLVFGGKAVTGRGTLYSAISKFNPANLGWSSVASNYNGPDLVYDHAAVWTGYSMMVWGGESKTQEKRPKEKTVNTGFIYYP